MKVYTFLTDGFETVEALAVIGPFLNHLMFGSYNARVVNPVTDKDWVCGNAEVIKEYVADEKCSYLFTVNGYLGLLDTIAYVKKYLISVKYQEIFR